MTTVEALIQLKDDIKEWVTNNLNAIGTTASASNTGIIVTVPAGGWTAQEDGTYLNTIAVDGLTGNELVTVSLTDEYSENEEICEVFVESINSIETAEDQLILEASSAIESDFNVIVSANLETEMTNASNAKHIAYDNSTSGLESINVNDAIDEVNSKTLSYNSETDYFGMMYNGSWVDIISAGLQRHWLYNNGDEVEHITGGWTSDGYTYHKDVTSSGNMVKEDSYITLNVTATNRRSFTIGTSNMIDLTDYNTIKFSFVGPSSGNLYEKSLDVSS